MPDHELLPGRAASALGHAGSYRRLLPVSLERLYENALDWEHLPHLHASSFSSVRCLDAGAWGWRAAVDAAGDPARAMVLELVLDRGCRRWITRVLDGSGAGSEIWTHAFCEERRRTSVVVDFFVPGLSAAERARAGAAYGRYFARLYDEDVAMMTERQRQLDRRIERAPEPERTMCLGPRRELALPLEVTVGGRELVLAEVAGELVAFPARCPHRLGPLGAAMLAGRVVTCPWHGDRFDVITGENLSGRPCPLSHLPRVTVDACGVVWISAATD